MQANALTVVGSFRTPQGFIGRLLASSFGYISGATAVALKPPLSTILDKVPSAIEVFELA
jgi:hypothetical protein